MLVEFHADGDGVRPNRPFRADDSYGSGYAGGVALWDFARAVPLTNGREAAVRRMPRNTRIGSIAFRVTRDPWSIAPRTAATSQVTMRIAL